MSLRTMDAFKKFLADSAPDFAFDFVRVPELSCYRVAVYRRRSLDKVYEGTVSDMFIGAAPFVQVHDWVQSIVGAAPVYGDAQGDITVKQEHTGSTSPIASVGRIVHYVAYGTPGGEYAAGAHRAAIITAVGEDYLVSLCILNPTGLFFTPGVRLDERAEPAPGTWHWPERV